MARYADLYANERDCHDRTRRELVHAAKIIEDFRQFLDAKNLQGDFADFMLSRFMAIVPQSEPR